MERSKFSVIGRTEKILVRGVNWLGDAIMTIPALRRLREARLNATIVLLTPAKLADLWRGFSAIDVCLSFAAHETVWQVGRRLKAEEFHTALILPNSVRSALEAWLGGIGLRLGYAAPWRNWLLTQAISRPPKVAVMRKRNARQIRALVAGSCPMNLPPVAASRESAANLNGQRQRRSHEAPLHSGSWAVRMASWPGEHHRNVPSLTPESHHLHHYLRLAAHLGANPAPLPPLLDLNAEESVAICARFGLNPSPAEPLLGLNPGAEYGPAKRWPCERFAAVAREVHRRTGCHCLIFGGPGDRELASKLAGELSSALAVSGSSPGLVRNLAGATTVRELCVLIKACRVFLTNDTGPMHIAAAVGTSVVALFGSTAPELTGPGLPGDLRHQLVTAHAPCSPCFRRDCPIDFRCMHEITTEPVLAAVLRGMALTG